jgi:hypothetical protein
MTSASTTSTNGTGRGGAHHNTSGTLCTNLSRELRQARHEGPASGLGQAASDSLLNPGVLAAEGDTYFPETNCSREKPSPSAAACAPWHVRKRIAGALEAPKRLH